MKALAPTDPEEIGPYRLVAALGHGAMGRVYLGAGPDGRLLAVKLLHERLFGDAEFRARFRREAAASRRVSGAYTAAVVDAAPDAATPWLASEFLLGPTLGEAVAAHGPLPEEAVLRLASGLASALTAVHRAGLVHRDLKPGNVVLAADGPRLVDFGIAQAAEAGPELTRTGGIIGTPGYMSPEQADSKTVTGASDVFSLGSVLVMASTGSSPFESDSTLRTLNAVVRAEPELSEVPPRVRAIVERCLARGAEDRIGPAELPSLVGPLAPAVRPWPETVAALAERQRRELERILDASGAGDLVVEPETPAAGRTETRIEQVPAAGTTLIDAGTTMLGEQPPEPSTKDDEEAGRPKSSRRRRTLLIGGLAGAAAAAAVSVRLLGDETGTDEGGEEEPVSQETSAGPVTTGFGVDAGSLAWPVYSPDGSLIASAVSVVESRVTAQIWDVLTGTEVIRLTGGGNAGCLAFSPDGDRLVTGGDTVNLWDLAVGAEPVPFDFQWAQAVAFGPDGSTVFTAGNDRVSSWDLATGRETALIEDYEHFYHMEPNPDGSIIATAAAAGVELWDAATGDKTAVLFEEPASMARFSPDGGLLAACGDATMSSGYLRVWDASSGELLFELGIGSTPSVAFSPDGALLASGSASAFGEGGVLLWDTATGEQLGHLEGEGAIHQMNFAPDMSAVATTGSGGRIVFYPLD